MRTFIHYQRPMRTRRTAKEMAAAFVIAGLAFAVGFGAIIHSGWKLGFLSVAALSAGLLALLIGCSLLWAFATGVVNDARITDQGILYNGKQWSWDNVLGIRVFPALSSGVVPVNVTVRRSGRSRLAIPIEIRDPEPQAVIRELQEFLASSGYDIPWR